MRPDYGIDAPTVVRNLLLAGFGAIVLALLLGGAHGFYVPLLSMGFSMGGAGGVMLWGSKFGKLSLRNKVVESLRLEGPERVLDLGCGRGLLLIAVAHRLTTGRAVGIDLWRKVDQSGNDRAETLYNARAERVEEKVELHTGDMRELPFEDGSFDCVVSSWAIHNLSEPGQRATALREAVRVLKPGGKLLIVDIGPVRSYPAVLEDAGMADVKVSDPNFLFLTPSWQVTGRKGTRQIA